MNYYWTDYPFAHLGDKAGEEAPIRKVPIQSWLDENVPRVLIDADRKGTHLSCIKAGYVYRSPGRCGEVAPITKEMCADPKWTGGGVPLCYHKCPLLDNGDGPVSSKCLLSGRDTHQICEAAVEGMASALRWISETYPKNSDAAKRARAALPEESERVARPDAISQLRDDMETAGMCRHCGATPGFHDRWCPHPNQQEPTK